MTEKRGYVKMTPQRIAEARALYADGSSRAEIAACLGVSVGSIHNHTKGMKRITIAQPIAHRPLTPPAPDVPGRWRVERAGSMTGGYLPGWFASNCDGESAVTATWREAIDYATKRAIEDDMRRLYEAAQQGLMKARARAAR